MPSRRALLRIPIALFLLPFWTAPAVMAVLFVAGALEAPDASAGMIAAGLAGVSVSGLFWYGFVAFFTYLMSLLCRTCTGLAADRDRDELRIRVSGWWLLLRRTVRVPLSQVRSLGFEIEGQQRITLRGAWEDAGGRAHELPRARLEVEGLDSRAEAMDLIFRLADAAGWWFYRVDRSDHLRAKVDLLREPETDDGQAQPVPEFGQPHQHEGVDYAATSDSELARRSAGHEAGVAAGSGEEAVEPVMELDRRYEGLAREDNEDGPTYYAVHDGDVYQINPEDGTESLASKPAIEAVVGLHRTDERLVGVVQGGDEDLAAVDAQDGSWLSGFVEVGSDEVGAVVLVPTQSLPGPGRVAVD